MIGFALDVNDFAETRFALSALNETALSLRLLREPSLGPLHLPWRRWALTRLEGVDTALLSALVTPALTLPDFVTPSPEGFAAAVDDELARVAATPTGLLAADIRDAYAPAPPPEPLRAATDGGERALRRLRSAVVAALRSYWRAALEPVWPRIRLLLEADTTYRARRLAQGGPRLLFADLHPGVRLEGATVRVRDVIGGYTAPPGRGLQLVPSAFAHKPAPPVTARAAPQLVYPARGTATLWQTPPAPDSGALVALLGPPRARLLRMLEEPAATVDLARRLGVTPSAVSQHLRVLHAAGLTAGARQGRTVLYRRTDIGDRLTAGG